jgi:hypothetical protein
MIRQNHDTQLTDLIDLREAEIAKISESKEDVAALRLHLQEIIEGRAFKGSHRSGQFLAYVVERAIAGHFESLKERVIGIELFGRVPSYDTGEDAIVRVTASDVRKRLLQHYGESGTSSKFRLSLPSGSYIPEITRIHNNGDSTRGEAANGSRPSATSTREGSVSHFESDAVHAEKAGDSQAVGAKGVYEATARRHRLLYIAVVLLSLNLILWGFVSYRSPRANVAGVPVLPWSALFTSSHPTHLITSDPNIVLVQEITGSEISVSDYANRKYIPEPNTLPPEVLRLCHIILWGDNSAAAVDPPIAVGIAALAQSGARTIDARASRSIQLSELKTDDNFIFLGSPRSDPWSSLFKDQLDFSFTFDHASGQEILHNVHPHQGEQSDYVPTAEGWATGRSYAIIAFIQNPDQNGQVLLLAGANGEGTEAAGRLVTDIPRLSAALDHCGIHSGLPLKHFEMLLELNTMAGSPNEVEVAACHVLPNASLH